MLKCSMTQSNCAEIRGVVQFPRPAQANRQWFGTCCSTVVGIHPAEAARRVPSCTVFWFAHWCALSRISFSLEC